MKQLIKNNKSGELTINEIPVPSLRDRHILVQNHYSAVSIGTESSSVDIAKKSLVQKARSRPDEFKKVLGMMEQEGVLSTYKKVMNKLELPSPLGYSSAGIVLEVGKGVESFRKGDRVACGGCGHAEVIAVPETLCVKVPDNVDLQHAAFTTIGAIALQGVRQAGVKLGENIVVIGLGIVGQITMQLIAAAGANPIGIDIDENIVEITRNRGFKAFNRNETSLDEKVLGLTGGYGADSVILTAGTSSNDPVELSGKIVRDKGTVTVVGAVGMDLPRGPFYMKELSFNLSRSYGPGRYDPNYEDKARDYPIGYVRWTENRNMEAVLDLMEKRNLDIENLITGTYRFTEAPGAYDEIRAGKTTVIGVVLEYDREIDASSRLQLSSSEKKPAGMESGIGFIGAGSYAQKFLLPFIAKEKGAIFKGLSTATGMNADHMGKKYGFEYVTTRAEDIVEDKSINSVFIATRHNLHAKFVIAALEADKHVFVEKPLAIREEELEEIKTVWEKSSGTLMVGFNRRFSPLLIKTKEFFRNAVSPLAINYRINAGSIPSDSWIQDPEVGGGRIVGEVCHFVDLCTFLTGSEIKAIHGERMDSLEKKRHDEDTLVVSIKYTDGSVAAISYFSNGDTKLPKERIEVFSESSCVIVDDFKSAKFISGGKIRKVKLGSQDKGQKNQMEGYFKALRSGVPLIPAEELFSVTEAVFKI